MMIRLHLLCTAERPHSPVLGDEALSVERQLFRHAQRWLRFPSALNKAVPALGTLLRRASKGYRAIIPLPAVAGGTGYGLERLKKITEHAIGSNILQ